MKPFEYFAPRTLEETCALLTQFRGDAKILAGGTDVLVEMRKPGSQPSHTLVDISRIASLSGIEESGDSIIIKPLTTHTAVLRSNIVIQYAPLLKQAVAGIGSPQIRNRARLAGTS